MGLLGEGRAGGDGRRGATGGVAALGLALGIRQMSMTVVMPFISTYCTTLAGYTPALAGLAVGIFGLMQAVLQIPFGIMADRHGNKGAMLVGLALVVVGGLLASTARDIWALVVARGLQGCGAIIGVGYSWAVGLAGRDGRVRAMSVLGAAVSAAAAISFAVGPLLREVLSVSQMFLACALLLAANAVFILVAVPEVRSADETAGASGLGVLLRSRSYVCLNLVAFVNNYLMISVFYAIPTVCARITGETGMWVVFVPAIAASVVVMRLVMAHVGPARGPLVLVASFATDAFGMACFLAEPSLPSLVMGMTLFMSGYVTCATGAASLVNECSPDSCRGAANGVFNSFQYVGNFVGALATSVLWAGSSSLTWFATMVVACVGAVLAGAVGRRGQTS